MNTIIQIKAFWDFFFFCKSGAPILLCKTYKSLSNKKPFYMLLMKQCCPLVVFPILQLCILFIENLLEMSVQ